jgi:predicted permease
MSPNDAIYEVKHALRTARTHPGFATAAVLSLAVGIGASTAIFSVVNAALLRELSVTNPQELVEITGRQGQQWSLVSHPMFQDMRDRQQVLTDMYASAGLLRRPVAGNGWRVERLGVVPVTGNFFSILGLAPQRGRLLEPSDDQTPGTLDESVAVLSDKFWRRQLSADPNVIGTTVQIGHRAYSIVGIAPRGFAGDTPGSSADIWVPLTALLTRDDVEARGGSSIAIIGRLKPGVSSQSAAALSGLYRNLLATELRTSEYTAVQKGTSIQEYRIDVRPASRGFDVLSQKFTRPLLILMGVVLSLLLISCCNFASLLLARARADQLGLALRSALGATRQRLLWRSLIESLTLAVMGVVAGVFIAWALGQALLTVVELGRDPIVLDVTPDSRVLGLGVMLGLVTGLAFGFAPAWLASAANADVALRQHRTVAGRERAHRIFGRGLVVGQIAISLVLTFATSLMIKTVINLNSMKHGFDPSGVLITDAMLDPDPEDRSRSLARVSDLHERLSSIPNLEAIGISGVGTFFGRQMGGRMLIRSGGGDRQIVGWFDEVSPDYFSALRIPLMSGRVIQRTDSPAAPRVAVVNTAFARTHFGNRNPIGEVLAIDRPALKNIPITVVGVVGDVRYKGARQEAGPMVYFSIFQGRGLVRSIEIRASGDPAPVLAQLRQTAALVDGNLQVLDTESLTSMMDAAIATERTLARLLTAFSVAALLLVFIGLYGLLSYTVTQLAPEIGIRAALGASVINIASLVATEALWMMGAGVVLGLLFVRTATRLVSAFLYNLHPTDPMMLMMTVVTLFTVGAVATFVPLARALRIDPLTALRAE